MKIDSARVVKLIVHRVGNRIREEGIRLSTHAVDASTDVDAILVDNYLRGTLDGGERYAFTHESTLDLNDVRRFAIEALADETHSPKPLGQSHATFTASRRIPV